jgi:hypothetical protein
MNHCNPIPETNAKIGLSIIEVNKNKSPKGAWKEFQTSEPPVSQWYNHYLNYGNVGIITGQVSENLEVIDIDVKNDPEKRVSDEFQKLIPGELYQKLLVVKTPSGGYHYYYRCPEAVIEQNQVLAKHSDGAVILETRGEGGYVCHHLTDYQVIQGEFDLVKLHFTIPMISQQERELLLTSARSLNRYLNPEKVQFQYKVDAINKFNAEFDGVELLTKAGWSVVSTDQGQTKLLRPGSSAHHSGTYFKKDNLFFCFSSSTNFEVNKPYNNYQILQTILEIKDYRQTLNKLSELGFKSEKSDTAKKKVSNQDIAEYLNNVGVRYNTFIQEIILQDKVIEERDNNTLYINLCDHFVKEVSRQKFENVIKSHLILIKDPINEFISTHMDRKPEGEIKRWLDCLHLKNDKIPRDILLYFVQKWFVGMVAQCLDGEYPNEFFLAILSTKQGVGKTTLLRKYTLPKELSSYRKEVSMSDSEDFALIMSQSLLIIDDEMDGRTLSEDKTFKAILSRKELPLRRKYDRRISNLHRRCSFAGCGNQLSVVRERQNRRIIPIEIDSIDYQKLEEVNQVDMFMEAYHLFKAGFKYSYDGSDAEKINQLAGDYFFKTDLDEIIDECILNPIDSEDISFVSSIEVINALNHKYPSFTRKVNTISVGKIFSDRGIAVSRKGVNKKSMYAISKRSSLNQVILDLKCSEMHPEVGFERKRPD